uniref:Peptidase S1 domain-containing protein n=1 Tax=Timema bartmani TaxID=61472 RepID=A0A7R9EQC5_9NEOP|nr:unnamed protein product [Timema bartmani]
MFAGLLCAFFMQQEVAYLYAAAFWPTQRIIGGTYIDIEEAPHQLSFLIRGIHRCGAAILNHHWAITAAHCPEGEDLRTLGLRAGSVFRNEGGTIHRVISVISHEMYDSFTYNNDISILKVKNSFVYSQKVAPISVCVSNRELPDGASLTITGWGHTQYHGNYSDQLQATILRKGPTNECNITYAGRITDKMICVYQVTADIPQGTCQGDSGGPLTYAGILVGVVSFAKGCAYKNYPTVYTKVSAFHHWIETKLADHKRSLFKNLAIPMRSVFHHQARIRYF